MRTILVTGGTGDLGRVVVERLLREYRCVVLYRSEAPPPPVIGIRADLDDEAQVKRAVRDAGELYALVHLVGGFSMENNASAWSKMLSLNLLAAATMIRNAEPRITDGGRIVAISSIASRDKPPGMAPYVVSKAALNALIEVTARELADRHITANALLPSTLATPQNVAAGGKLVPLEAVAAKIAWLLSEEASNITGTLIPMEG